MVRIVDYNPSFSVPFKALNYAWIKQLFDIEDSDREVLENPEIQIIDKGGAVLIATLDDEAVGTCALIRIDDETYELAKMAVSEEARGQQIGWRLGVAALDKARQFGAKKVRLDTNSALIPAITLYKKLGFQQINPKCSSYQRCDIQMEIEL